MRDRNAPLSTADVAGLAWAKMGGLLPAVIQDSASGALLMLGYMNEEALQATLDSGFATFFSRSKGRLWRKGETSGNRLRVVSVHEDCDGDALLVRADPEGPTCHLGTQSCFGGATGGPGWLADLSKIVAGRIASGDPASYSVALAAVTRDAAGCAEEVADLLYHLAVLMETNGFGWNEVIAVLQARHKK